MLRVVKNVTWRQCITNEVLYAGLPRTSTTIRDRRLRFSGHCWRNENEVVSDLVLWELKHGKRNIRGQARTFVDLLEADTGVLRDCLPDDRVGWRKKLFVCWLLAQRPSNMLVYLRDASTQTIVHAARLR